MIKIYPLEWLDNLILQTLKPDNINSTSITKHDLSLISADLLKESRKIQIQIKNEVFAIRKKRHIRLLVRKYHSSFIFLLDNIVENKNNQLFKNDELAAIADIIITSIDGLLSFIEARFASFLSLDHRVPLTYTIVSRNELQLKIRKLKSKKIVFDTEKNMLNVVINSLNDVLQSSTGYKSTYRHLLYQKELLRKIEQFDFSKESDIFFTNFDELLIEANFNGSDYVHSLIDRISARLEIHQSLKHRMNELLYLFKEFNQFHSCEKFSFDPCQKNIKESLGAWFRNEIDYMKQRIEFSGEVNTTDPILEKGEKDERIQSKIECVLSSDQIALILRASDESRILRAKSMSQVFKTIVPHLSTPFKKDLSYQSVRSKSYNAEERDKKIAIEILEKIITKIQSY
ncbi:hypothetical protein [Flavobacterium sp. 2]|uniref:hypothetical protein n=1 Tax=Flavobacterium sp. 2 TaxID=308053 RepID=UPI003CE6DDC2